MSVNLLIKIEDNATPAIAAKLQQVKPERLRAILGPGMTVFVQNHLLSNGTNKKGWPSTHFWADAARGTSWTADSGGSGLVITINKIGVRQRYYGGTIAPVKAKALAIPISPVSYGHVPSDFPGLFLLVTKKGAYLVQYGQELSGAGNIVQRGKNSGGNKKVRLQGTLNFLFMLVGSVDQAPDPTVIPSNDQLAEVGLALIERAIT